MSGKDKERLRIRNLELKVASLEKERRAMMADLGTYMLIVDQQKQLVYRMGTAISLLVRKGTITNKEIEEETRRLQDEATKLNSNKEASSEASVQPEGKGSEEDTSGDS